jgi:hypothetical protein
MIQTHLREIHMLILRGVELDCKMRVALNIFLNGHAYQIHTVLLTPRLEDQGAGPAEESSTSPRGVRRRKLRMFSEARSAFVYTKNTHCCMSDDSPVIEEEAHIALEGSRRQRREATSIV